MQKAEIIQHLEAIKEKLIELTSGNVMHDKFYINKRVDVVIKKLKEL